MAKESEKQQEIKLDNQINNLEEQENKQRNILNKTLTKYTQIK